MLAASATWLNADSLPLGVTVAVAELANGSGTLCSQSGVSSASCSLSGATANAVVTDGQGGMASVSLGNSATFGAAATGYFIGIEGPSNINVPIIINGYATTQDNSSFYGDSFASYFIYQGSSTGYTFFDQYFASPYVCSILNSTATPCMSTGNFSLNTSIAANSVFYVLFEAAAGGTNASALIDPTIMIDPSFTLASEFTLVSNPGVFTPPPTSSAMPEPTPVVLLATGLIVVGLGTRRFSRNRSNA